MQLIPPKSPALPTAPKEYRATEQEQYSSVLRQYFLRMDGTFQQLLLGFNNYGVFTDTTTQTPAVINTAYPVTMNTTVESFGVKLDAVTSRVVVPVAGVYRFIYTVQLDKTTVGVADIHTWFRLNGTDVANTANHTAISGVRDQKTATGVYTAKLNAGDYVEVVWSADSTATQLHFVAAAAPVPAVPSIKLDVSYLFPG